MVKLTHINENGDARMVDVSGKTPVKRTATASGTIHHHYGYRRNLTDFSRKS